MNPRKQKVDLQISGVLHTRLIEIHTEGVDPDVASSEAPITSKASLKVRGSSVRVIKSFRPGGYLGLAADSLLTTSNGRELRMDHEVGFRGQKRDKYQLRLISKIDRSNWVYQGADI